MPKTGRFVLADEICDTAVIWIVCILAGLRVAFLTGDPAGFGRAARGLVIALLLAVGIWFTKDVALDIAAGPEITVLSDLQIVKSQAHTGIFSHHYYLKGTDRRGERIQLEITGDDYSEISRDDTIRVACYRNTGRVVRFYR